MKEKLLKIREALNEAIDAITSQYCSHNGSCDAGQERCWAQDQYKALILLDNILSSLDSKKLKERVAIAMFVSDNNQASSFSKITLSIQDKYRERAKEIVKNIKKLPDQGIENG